MRLYIAPFHMKAVFAFCALLLLTQCRPQSANTYPFEVEQVAPDSRWAPRYQFTIAAGTNRLTDYYDLFERYGYGGNGASWAEHIRYLLNQQQPDLLTRQHLFFNEEGDAFYVHVDNEHTLARFMQVVRPVFGSRAELQRYLKQADPEEFSE
jgi:Immunity protein 51